MKKALIPLLIMTQVYATSAQSSCPDYRTFNVYVKNNTSFECVFTKQILRRGILKSFDTFSSLRPNEEKNIMTIEDFTYQGSDVVVTYQCGDNYVTFESERDVWASDSKYVKGWIWSATNMNALFTSSYGNCEENKSAQINWILY